MDLSPYLSSLRQDLAATASTADEATQRGAQLLVGAIEPAARLALMTALSDMAAEVTSQLPGQTVDVRLDGRDVKVVVNEQPAKTGAEPEPDAQQPAGDATGDISRITLRMMEEIKAKAEDAAAAQGLSLNSFVSQAVQGALAGKRPRQPGNRGEEDASMRGWTQW